MFNEFDQIRIISLKDRSDRRREMKQELHKIGLASDVRVSFFDAIRPPDRGTFSSKGAHGCYLSHCEVLEQAAAAGSSVLIVEDDCDIDAAAKRIVLKPDWQIFYGGYDAKDQQNLAASDITGSYLMGFNSDIIPDLLGYLRSLRIDGQHPPIDAAYVWFRRSFPDTRTIFADPSIGSQRPSRSDIEPGAIYNRVLGVRNVVQAIRRLRRAGSVRRT